MVSEGGLRKPERKAMHINDPKFWNEGELDAELRRQFDVCREPVGSRLEICSRLNES